MSYLSHLVTSIAISDIDVAEKGMRALIDPEGEYYPPGLRSGAGAGGDEPPDPLEWAHYLCTYSRYLYLNVWKYRCSVDRVRDNIIPILKNAKALIARLVQEYDLSKKDKSDLAKYEENISLRIKNLLSYT